MRLISGYRNVLGLEYLDRYRVTIDFPKERIYLAKARQFASPERGDTCGLRYPFRMNRLEIQSVNGKSPADTAGARAKDVIVELGDKSVSELKPSEVSRLLTTEGKPVRMTVQRGGQRIEITYTPKEYD